MKVEAAWKGRERVSTMTRKVEKGSEEKKRRKTKE